MTEPLLFQPPLVARARRLFTLSTIGPLIVYLAVAVPLVLDGRPSETHVFIAICSMIFLIIKAWLTYWNGHNTPDVWRFATANTGIFVAFFFLIVIFGIPEGKRFGLNTPTFSVVTGALTLGILLLSWLPARRATRRVLDDLSSPDVVNSSLVIRFTSRADYKDILAVTPESLDIMRRDATFKTARSYPLTDVSAVTTRTEPDDGEHPVPDLARRSVKVKRGEVVVVELPAGQLVFPVKDPQRFIQFVEERRAALVNE